MNKKVRIILPFSLYILGVLSFLILDIYISANYTKKLISEWAFYKSTLFILGGICLLGLDQVVVRSPQLIKIVYKKFIFQSVLIAFCAVFIISYFRSLDFSNTILLFTSVILFSFILFISACARANNKLWQAQLTTNGWKVVLLLFILLFNFSLISLYFILAFLIIIIISFYFKGYCHNENDLYIGSDDNDYSAIGFAFLLHNLSLVVAIHGEQFFINLAGDIDASNHLYTYFVFFTPVAISTYGFIGFYLGPKIRRVKLFIVKDFYKLILKLFIFSIFITLISILIGVYGLNYVHGIGLNALDFLMVGSLAAICLLRGVYTSSSTVLGVYGSREFLYKAAILNWLVLIVYIITIFFTLYFYEGVYAANIIVLCSVTHWFLRFVISGIYALYSIKYTCDNNL